MTKLNQIIAIEKGSKSQLQSRLTELYKIIQKPGLFAGHLKRYEPLHEEGEQLPDDVQRVQHSASKMIQAMPLILGPLWDTVATKDAANTQALADVVVDGEKILDTVPVTYLLFLEKELVNIRAFINHAPTLSPDEDWYWDSNAEQWRTEATRALRTKKMVKPIVKYDATPEHPAQTDLIQEDVPVGNWLTTKRSGALPEPLKQDMLDQVDRLIKAVKMAREEANGIEAPKKQVADKIFDFLLKPLRAEAVTTQ